MDPIIFKLSGNYFYILDITLFFQSWNMSNVNRVTLNDKLDKINVKLACECGLYHFMTGHLCYYNFQVSTEWDQNIYEDFFSLAFSI